MSRSPSPRPTPDFLREWFGSHAHDMSKYDLAQLRTEVLHSSVLCETELEGQPLFREAENAEQTARVLDRAEEFLEWVLYGDRRMNISQLVNGADGG